MSVYSPQTGCDEEEKTMFWEELDGELRRYQAERRCGSEEILMTTVEETIVEMKTP